MNIITIIIIVICVIISFIILGIIIGLFYLKKTEKPITENIDKENFKINSSEENMNKEN